MCKLCEASEDGEMVSCQDCGRLICFDVKNGDDVIRPAYVTTSADLYCDLCGSAHDRAEEAEEDEEDIDYEDEEFPSLHADGSENTEFGCLFPGECLMPGLHLKHECHTAEMVEDQARSAMKHKLSLLVKAAIELAVARHNLVVEFADEDDPMDVDVIADDVIGALQGIGCCDDTVMKEWQDLIDGRGDQQ